MNGEEKAVSACAASVPNEFVMDFGTETLVSKTRS